LSPNPKIVTGWYGGSVLNLEFFERARGVFGVLDRLEPEALDRVRAGGQEVRMPSDSWLFRLGDRCDGFGFVVDGCVKVSISSESGREMVLYRVRPGESCTVTVSCLINDRPYPAEGITEGPLEAVSIPKELFNELVGSSAVFRRFVLEIFSSRVNSLMELVNQVAFNKLDQRLASRLLELGPVVEMTHQELAGELGTTREMVSRLLENFADQGLVALGRKRIVIEDSGAFKLMLGEC
jgi:CRP/FNR family transcriptional regulator